MPIPIRKFNFVITVSAMLAMCALLAPKKAFCRLSAEAELSYANYDVSDRTGRHLSANSLSQRYSVLYGKQGRFMEGRMGMYDVALGYEWSTFDTSIKSTDNNSSSPSASNGHIIFSGEVLVDPKEFPLKLSVYSRDLTRSTWIRESNTRQYSYTNSPLVSDGLVAPDFITGIQNGQHVESGATLVLGVKNGMTNGYNELFRHFPMIMLDYRDQINKDYSSLYPENNRLSRLAFVSLNKKDNWFHYRYTTYKDYINSGNSYNETQIQLGTVDQTMQRRWVDFANWLQVSADGLLSKRVINNSLSTEEFTLNLFATARRKTWEARTFNSFTREKNNNDLITYKTNVPVYVSGIFSPTSTWNAYLTYNDSKNNKGGQFTTTSAGYQADAFTRSTFTLKHGIGVETATGSDIISGMIGTASTSRFSRVFSLAADYNIRRYMYDNNAFTSQSFNANARYVVNNQLSFLLSQTNNFTSGRSRAIGGGVSGASTFTEQYYNPRTGSYDVGSSYQSVTGLSASWNPLPRLNVTFSATEDVYKPADGPNNIITTLENNVDYSVSNLRFSSKNLYSHGNSSGSSSPYNTAGQVSSQNTASYIFSRNMDARLKVSYYKWIDQSSQPDKLEVEQNFNYYYYQTRGVARKIFEINEAFIRRDEPYNSGVVVRNNEFSLGAKYYPMRQLLVGGGARYIFAKRLDDYSVSYFGTIALQFRLLEASIDYTYGKNTSDGRIEKKFMANVKKKF